LLAFVLVVFAVGLVPAPVRAEEKVREEEEQAVREREDDAEATDQPSTDGDRVRPDSAPAGQPSREGALVAEQA
jgi:hypothetical protein